ncbi:hypothetical protein B0T16DRAFT_458346 [Cercophora newfieldiana]|uniref:Uncharacterized protein n=1 Tax=Cercophora newfieldiana TaxID=92897 RepID=A0AA39Y8G5_9PEZI|nr:hypothetical protein B0T16DRAFT_458346 [Cercophora newfieldiana]
MSPEAQPIAIAEKDVAVVVTTTELGHQGELTSSPIEECKETKDTKEVGKTPSWSSEDSAGTESVSSVGSRPFWRQWLVEMVFCLLSLLSFVVIVAVLGAYDGQSLPQLPLHVTLNTFLAFFTTLCKAAFMTPITEAFSQWKWNLLTQKENGQGRTRSLADFEVLDSASRGTWGSWKVLRNFKWQHFVSLAAFFSILSIFTSPITQQMIEYKERPAPVVAEASVLYSRDFSRDAARSLQDITKATFAGMSSSLEHPVLPLAAGCGSSNCTFERYKSLGMCMKINNITHLLTVFEIKNSTSEHWTGGNNRANAVYEGNGTTSWNASLPLGINFVSPLSFAMMLAGNDKSLSFLDSRDDNYTAISHFYVMYSNAGNVSYPGRDRSQDKPWEWQALEIMFHACVITYETEVTAGISTTRQIATSNAVLDTPNNLPLYNANCTLKIDFAINFCDYADQKGGQTYLKDPDFPDDPTKFYAFDRRVSNMITYNSYFDLSNSFMADGVPNHLASFMKQNYFALRTALYGVNYQLNDTKKQFENLSIYFNGTATAVSNMIRSSVLDSKKLQGVAWSNETFVFIQWGWAAFLAVQMALAYMFLAATIYRTKKLGTPVLKSSELAVLLASTDEVRRAVGSVDELQEAGEKAKKINVRFEEGRLKLA